MGFIDYLLLILYMVGMLVVGYIARGQMKSMDDFILGGKRFGLFALTGTIIATMVGSGMVLGAVGNAYKNGATGTVFWMYAGFALGLFFFGLISEKVRDTGARSMAELISLKFGKTSRTVAAVIILIYAVSIVAINIAGLRTVLTALFGDLSVSMPLMTVIAASIAIIYTSMGGFLSVVWTDAIQIILMVVGIIIIGPIIGLNEAGGFSNVAKTFEAMGSSMTNPMLNGISAGSIGFFLAYFLMVPGDPTMPQRSLSAKDGKVSKKAFYIAGFIAIFMGLSLLIIGGTSQVILPNLENAEHALLQIILQYYPPVLKGIIIAGLIAAIMSSFDSFLILATTHFVYDLGSVFGGKVSEEKLTKMMPWFTVGIGLIGIIIALFIQSLFAYLYMVFSVVGSALVPAFLVALYWPEKSNRIAVNASMIIGTLVPAYLYLTKGYDVFLGDPVFLGIISSTLAIIILSLVLPKDKKQQED